MANKTLFKSLIGKLMPATDALNEEHAPAYALSPKHQLGPVRRNRLSEHNFLCRRRRAAGQGARTLCGS